MTTSPRISIIAAIGANRELGAAGGLLWHIPEDFTYFRTVTMGKPVVMGRRTYDSLPAKARPLPGRTNVVVQGVDEPLPSATDVIVTHDIPSAIAAAYDAARRAGVDEVFVIGGASIYAQTLDVADRLYLTLVDATFPHADVFFPTYEEVFPRCVMSRESSDEQFRYTFVIREKQA